MARPAPGRPRPAGRSARGVQPLLPEGNLQAAGLAEDPGQFVRACLDSLALTYRATIEGLEDILDKKIDVIHIVGGGTQNELLNQMTADACGRRVIAGPVEATSIGNILVQAMAIGAINSLADARAVVRNSFPVKAYDPIDTARWDDAYIAYGQYRKALSAAHG